VLCGVKVFVFFTSAEGGVKRRLCIECVLTKAELRFDKKKLEDIEEKYDNMGKNHNMLCHCGWV